MEELQIREKIGEYTRFRPPARLNIITDTSEFMNIKADDILDLGGALYLVRGEEVEGRFGLDGEPKYWVKRAIDLADGSAKVIKLEFYESFTMQLGVQQIRCFRSPQKEARILDKTRDDPFFMQGINVRDAKGNAVRIIERIAGARYYDYIYSIEMDHEAYFHTLFPEVLRNIISSIEALQRLHAMMELHGDVRNDHILIDRKTGRYTWIDFDYTYEWSENPFGVDLFGLGNILLFTIGKGFHTIPDLSACGPAGMALKSCVTNADMSLFFKHRIINLKKLFPYIPDSLNYILLHFGQEAKVFYETTAELLEDLKECGIA